MTFINIGTSRAAGHALPATCTTRSAGGQMTGGKGGKDANRFPGPYSGTKEFPVFPAAAQDRVVLLGSGALAG